MRLCDIKLTGEQEKIYALPFTGTVLIKGAAGSGKTVVALKRTEHLLFTQQQMLKFGGECDTVCFTTFNKKLTEDISEIIGTHHNLMVCNIDKLVYAFLKDYCGYDYRSLKINISDLDEFVKIAKQKVMSEYFAQGKQRAIFARDDLFFSDEIKYIKGLGIADEDTYLKLERRGRGGTTGALHKEDRHLIWQILEHYNLTLQENHTMDFEDRVNLAVKFTELPEFKPYIKHLVVDEAQDCSVQKLKFLKNLVIVDGGSLTLIADMAQRIYNVSFSWKNAGIMIHGSRSWELKRNHRNTLQIAKVGESIRSHAKSNEEFTSIEFPTRQGSIPELIVSSETDVIRQEVLNRIKSIPGKDTVITTWRKRDVYLIKNLLDRNGVSCTVDTIHSLKGRSFKHVFVIGISATILPYSDDEEENETRRNLLYVAVTRATESLTMAYSGRPSPFIEEIDQSLLSIKHLSGKVLAC